MRVHTRDISDIEATRLALVRALDSVRMLAAMAKSYKRGWRPEDADHILRICAEVGIVAHIERSARQLDKVLGKATKPKEQGS